MIDKNEEEGGHMFTRMNERIMKLEEQMNKLLELKERRRQLINQEHNLDIQPLGSDKTSRREEEGKEVRHRQIRTEKGSANRMEGLQDKL